MLKKFLLLALFLQLAALPLNAMRIFIAVEGGDEFAINLEPSDEISTMRMMVAEELNVSVSQIRLIFGNKELEDSRTLSDYNIQKDSRVAAQNITLPVEIHSFDVVKRTTGVTIKWTTSSEKNNQYFLVSRSSDGETFQVIDQKRPSTANSEVNQVYSLEDKRPFSGLNYYKLEQVDLNGKVNLVGVKPISFAYATVISAYPNPSKGKASVSFDANKFDRVVVYDLSGKAIIRQAVKAGASSFELDLSTHQAGQYFVELSSARERSVTVLVKQ